MFSVAISPPEMTFTYCATWGCWMSAQDMHTQQTLLLELLCMRKYTNSSHLILEGV